MGGFSSDGTAGPLVETEANPAGDEALSRGDEGVERLPERRKPPPVVDEFGVFRHQHLLEVHGLAVENEALQFPVGGVQHRGPRRLVDLPGLDADKAVFHQIGDADPVLSPEAVHLFDE